MRLIFMGTPDFAVPVLDALVDAGHDIAAVYCQPPRPAGRGKKDRPTPVHARAEALGLPVHHPKSLRNADAQEAFAAHGAEAAVVVAYGLILPQAVLDAPTYGCINIHASLLPRWRGAAPIHRAIMAGDTQTGIAIMQMEAGLDTGPVLMAEALDIGAEETTGQLQDRLSQMGARMIVETLMKLRSLTPEPQSTEGVSYAEKIDKAEARIDWTRPARIVDRQIRGLAPWPGAWTEAGETRLKLLGSRLAEGSGAPGEVLEGGFRVACGEGAVEITRAQKPGRGAQDADDFLRGTDLPAGTILGKDD
ncbi:Methionyl-tRNA formyltransferase [Roseivivax sp. THAF40]|uniref:methionyl-tRNA formyltransferase n=1 Tax=unclassified Roseivivax TaxID=2639302 RepID=UPI001268698D|nr:MULTISPECIES: methionyl-tRNA formyltransferase [unclassified Roseivivax]QFS81390.1 Methionyl-tRNA formyltransferase [Roseivivax sp. THAF197b]QFT45119.1 Methionyl-tRNA formyltransferase [Roseivivax sp. THAF40]